LHNVVYSDAQLDSARASGSVAAGVLNIDSLFALWSGVRATGNGALGITDSTSGTLQFRVVVDSLGVLSR
jgi:hypothetical protein